jgi:hypothetical protein
MAFDATQLAGPVGLGAGKPQGKMFVYDAPISETPALVTAAGYFAEMGLGAAPASSRGMEKGDIVLVRYFDSLTTKANYYGSEWYEVTAVDSDGDVTVSGSGSAAITATADGLTTGLINPGVVNAVVTSASVDNIVTLPAPVPGKRVTIGIAATGCEIRSVTGVTINAVAFPNELALAANSYAVCFAISATEWVIKTYTKAGVISGTDIPNA